MAKFSLLAKLGLDSKGFQQGIDKADSKRKRFQKGLGGLKGVLAGLGLSRVAMNAIQLGSRLSDLATQVDINVEKFQVLKFAAQEAGASQESLTRALRNLKDRGQQAENGMKSYADAFDKLNINVEEFNKLPQEEKMLAVAKAAQAAKEKGLDPFSSVMDILGERAGPELQEVLQRLANEGFPALEASARDAGQVMDEDVIMTMDEAADKIESFKTRMTVLTGVILDKAIPAFNIFKNGIGLITDGIGSQVAVVFAFGKALGHVLKAVVQPGIKAFQSLSKAVESGKQAMTGNLKASREAMKESGRLAKESAQSIAEIPQAMGQAIKDVTTEVESSAKVMGESIETRNKEIEESWDALWGNVKQGSEETKNKVVSDLGIIGTGMDEMFGNATKASDELRGDMDNLYGLIKDGGIEAFGAMSDAAQGATDNISDNVQQINEELSNFFDDLDEQGQRIQERLSATRDAAKARQADANAARNGSFEEQMERLQNNLRIYETSGNKSAADTVRAAMDQLRLDQHGGRSGSGAGGQIRFGSGAGGGGGGAAALGLSNVLKDEKTRITFQIHQLEKELSQGNGAPNPNIKTEIRLLESRLHRLEMEPISIRNRALKAKAEEEKKEKQKQLNIKPTDSDLQASDWQLMQTAAGRKELRHMRAKMEAQKGRRLNANEGVFSRQVEGKFDKQLEKLSSIDRRLEGVFVNQ